MDHIIKNVISSQDIGLLKSLIGNGTYNIVVDEVGVVALSIFIESYQSKIVIKNNPSKGSDKDDYPRFELAQVQDVLPNCKEICKGKKIINISIIKDKVMWRYQGHKWIVEIDVGIKIIFEEDELLLVAHDTLAGLIGMFNLDKSSKINECLEEYWSMKTEDMMSLDREEIWIG
ncbi:hypothetical protein ABEW34_11905 [Paenibacillus algorifonticola]|uniref:hypothetical protein n=1 Tax=Paenibacillus algorifonticola TaxID=684063 RepID=UPI003D26E04E